MNRRNIRRNILTRTLTAIAALILTAGLFAGCSHSGGSEIRTLSDLGKPGAKIGVGFNLPEYDMLKKDYPDAEIIVYNDNPLAYEDVAHGRIDAYFNSRIEMGFAIANGTSGVRLINENYSSRTVAVGLSPSSHIPDLQEKINDFIAEIRENGTLDGMYERWVILDDDTMPEIPVPDHPAYHLRVGTTGTIMPYSYYVGNELRGYDIELAYRFAAWLGADIEFKIYDFGGVIAAAASGDVDCIMSNLFKTDENSGTIPFSDTLFEVELTAMVKNPVSDGSVSSLSDLEHATIGVMTGTNFPEHVKKSLPEADLLFYNSMADAVTALKKKKVDAIALDEPVARNVMAQDSSITVLPDLLEAVSYGFIFPKSEEGEALRDELNEFLKKIEDDGTMQSLREKWFDASDLSTVEIPDYRKLPDDRGTIMFATLQNPPFSFSAEDLSGGYDIEIFYLFCLEYGYGLEVTDMSSDAVIPAVQSGKYDTAACGISITEERKESMLFSEPDYSGGTVLAIRSGSADGAAKNFWESIADSFQKTFIRENRWKLFLEGIGTTLLITVFSIILGTALGFFVFMRCRKGNRIANAVTRFCIWLIHGMPVVILLMILYYIIFGDVAISGTVVSIIGFTLIFAAAVFNMVKSGVGAIDRGQTEAAYALGYTDRRAFYRIIFPQALPHFMPAYKGEITSLIKATAVVGYVAVQDLTKMGDIVRSRTYEAFFPLIAVAIIYFVLAAILTFIVKKIEIRIDPRRRSPEDILKGVENK